MLPKQKHLNGGGWEVKTAEGEDIKMLISDKLHSTKDRSLMLEATGKEATALLVYAVVYEFMPSHQPQVNSFQDASSSSIWFKPPQFKLVSKFPISQSDRASMRYAGSPIQIGPILHQQESKETPSPPWCQTQTGTTCLMGLGSVWALLSQVTLEQFWQCDRAHCPAIRELLLWRGVFGLSPIYNWYPFPSLSDAT